MVMAQSQSQDCPLCSKPAEYRFADFENRKHFICSNCTEFQISINAEKRLSRSPAAWIVGLGQRAREHPEDSTLVITLPGGPP